MESFEVDNFRSLKHLKLEKLARVNLLVGKNNSGKTSVLEGLFVIANIRNPYWVQNIESTRNLSADRSDFRHLFYGFDTSKSIALSGTYCGEIIEAQVPIATLSAALSLVDRHTLLPRELVYYERQPNTPKNPHAPDSLLVILQTPEVDIPIGFELRRSFKQEYMELYPRDNKSRAYLEQGPAFIAGPRNLAKLLTTRSNLYWLNDELEGLKVNKEENQLLEVLRSLDKRIQRIELSPSGQIYLDLGQDFRTLLPLNLMGEGIQRLLSIISAIASNAGGIVLIDELDNGLHYSALRVLWKGILHAALEYNVQIIATTHSAEALRHLTWVLDEEENAGYRDDVAAYTLIRAEDDTVRSYRHDYEQLEYAIEHGIEVRN
ncbi:AAA family ATPase [Hymenobacter ruricola]|uniref:AAA family ATPase n=1 Tax=Hymenobacter ruricola TaxID=2791023 RepID=A0ABS0IA21_9BACT|nr:ATP-binding protein [Hymenobacter ruricola]MBF9223759.1 AAA family ATPase [Hymenobacter ruricola]